MFATICAAALKGLKDAIAHRASRAHQAARPALCIALNVVWYYINRADQRLQRLIAKWRAGTLPKSRIRAKRPTEQRTRERIRLPSKHVWLNPHFPEVFGHADYLRQGFATEEMQRFLAEVPSAGRILRPLCKLLLLEIPAPIRPPPPKPRPKKPREPKPKLDFGGKYPRYNWRTYSPGKIPPAKKSTKA